MTSRILVKVDQVGPPSRVVLLGDFTRNDRVNWLSGTSQKR